MPFCPIHGFQQGKHCSQCGSTLSNSPPDAGNSVRVRSPESHAHASTNPTFVLPGGHVETLPALVKCPKCGKRSLEPATFDCQGDCGRQNLCERHFDEEYEVCVDCARALRGEAEAEAARQATLRADLASWRQHAEEAESQINALTRQGSQAQLALELARADLRQAEERVRSLDQELAVQRRRAEQVEANVAALTKRREQAETNLTQRTTALSQSQDRAQGLEKDLTNWRCRAEKTEGELAAIERARQEAEARKQAEAEAARRCAEEAKRQQRAICQQIGIKLMRIPAGEFLYGDRKRKVHLQEYGIARTPVTNAQYAAFVRATGHPVPSHWKDGSIPAGKENHPVVNVSWDDAQKFCQWTGLRLPTEQEWEKAARGTDGREYPWGNQPPSKKLCNFKKNVKDTTPVSQYPAGASPYGLLDMAGNVWEWCEDCFEAQPYYTRVLRGGSWGSDAYFQRVTSRQGIIPDYRSAGFGFRPACSP